MNQALGADSGKRVMVVVTNKSDLTDAGQFQSALENSVKKAGHILVDAKVQEKLLEEAGLRTDETLEEDDMEDLCDSLNAQILLTIDIREWSMAVQQQTLAERLKSSRRWAFHMAAFIQCYTARNYRLRNWTGQWSQECSANSGSTGQFAAKEKFLNLRADGIVGEWLKK